MAKEISIDTKPRPEFSRFEKNLASGDPLPIFPLAYPDNGRVGVVIVGDYISQDLVHHLRSINEALRSQWLIISTTQSDAIPTDCVDVDFNFFTNESGIDRYLASEAANVPCSTELGDGHYVDQDLFTPDKNVVKQWDIVYPAKWYPTKNTNILLESAAIDPSIKIAIFGWPVVSERKIKQSLEYRDLIIAMAQHLPNVDIFDSGFEADSVSHFNQDGSVVIGNLTKEEMRDRFHRKARTSIFLSETTEAINRVCTEMLCCDVPMMVTPTNGGLEKLVNERTGILIERTPQSIVEGVHHLLENLDRYNPRQEFLKSYGKENANIRLREIISQIANSKGVEVNWGDMRYYNGDLWTAPGIYKTITT